jgi:hypothetical protein
MSEAPDRLDSNLERLRALVRGNFGETDAFHPDSRVAGQNADSEWDVFSRLLHRLGLR